MTTPTWTTPTTWSTGDTPTAAQFNAQLRDNVLSTATPAMLIATKTATQALTTGTFTDITWTSETYKTDTGIHDTVTNNTRLIVPTGLGGVWEVTATLGYAPSAAGTNRYLGFAKNGGTVQGAASSGPQSTSNAFVCATAAFVLVAGDYITVQGWHDVGANLNILAASYVYFRRVSN